MLCRSYSYQQESLRLIANDVVSAVEAIRQQVKQKVKQKDIQLRIPKDIRRRQLLFNPNFTLYVSSGNSGAEAIAMEMALVVEGLVVEPFEFEPAAVKRFKSQMKRRRSTAFEAMKNIGKQSTAALSSSRRSTVHLVRQSIVARERTLGFHPRQSAFLIYLNKETWSSDDSGQLITHVRSARRVFLFQGSVGCGRGTDRCFPTCCCR